MNAITTLDRLERHAETGVVATTPLLRAEIVRERAGIDALASDWTELEAHAGGLTLFQGLGWARAVFDFAAASNQEDFDPVIVTLREGARLVALMPLERIREKGRTGLVPLGNAFAQYADILLAPGIPAREAVKQLIKAALIAAPADTLHLLKVRDDSALGRGLPDNRIVTGAEQGAPYVELGGFADFDAYFATLKSKTRKNMRNARNRLEREGEVTHVVAETSEARLQVIERTLNGRAERLKEQGLSSRAFRDTRFAEFCKSLAGKADIDLVAYSLMHKGQPIAEQWGFVHQGHYYAFVASRDFSNSDESPGKLHLGEVLRAAYAHGARGSDLGVPVMPYKLTWATNTVTVRDYALAANLKGLAIVTLWDVMRRPLLKKAVLAMPPGLRTRLMKLAGAGG